MLLCILLRGVQNFYKKLLKVKDMSENPVKFIKDLINSHLSIIENEEFRFAIFIKLNEEQLFLLNIYQSNRGFLDQLKGIQIRMDNNFANIMKDKEKYESNENIKTDYPFLYGKFIKDSTLYLRKIYFGNQLIGYLSFIIKNEFIPENVKEILENLIQKIKPFLIELYIKVKDDIARRYTAINALNITKNMRPRTFYHSFRVADMAVAIADKIGLSKSSIRNLCYAALIHDIGEMYIPNDLFYKKGTYFEEEMKIIKQHPHFLKVIFARNPLMEDIVNIAYYHHERVDGTGYFGVKGNELSKESKILSLCEIVDGLYTDRPDRKGLDMKRIIAIVKRLRGKAFDREIADASLEILEKYYIAKDFEFSNSNHMSNIGKPTVVVLEKENKIKLLQGVIEYITSNITGIEFFQDTDHIIEIGKPVRVQLFFFDLMFNFKGTVISSSKNYVNVLIKETGESVFGSLHVFWEFDAIAIPMKTSLDKDLKHKNAQVIKLKTKRFGSKSLTAKIENPVLDLNIGDTVLLRMKPLKDTITIPAIVSNIIKEGEIYTVYFEYFNLPERTDALIHQAIYYKQSQQNRI